MSASPPNLFKPTAKALPVEWAISEKPVPYLAAENFMKTRAGEIARGEARELVWLLEHPPLYTAGTSAKIEDLIDPDRFPVFKTGRGGQFTYHGPGQRVAYVMLNLKARKPDVRLFVATLESWLIDTLGKLDVHGQTRCGRVGIWVDRTPPHTGEDKIAALGIRLSKWVSFHGISLNVDPDLSHFGGIVPCGISEHGVTSLANLGKETTMTKIDQSLQDTFQARFGDIIIAAAPQLSETEAA